MELRLSERHLIALNFLLVAILAYFAAVSVNDIIALRLAPAPAMPAPANTTAHAPTTAHPRGYYQDIVNRDIFHHTPVEAPAPAAPVVEDLHLTLLAVSIATGGKSFAIIEDRTGQQAIYRVGEYVPNAGTLIQVDSKRAVIDRNGKH